MRLAGIIKGGFYPTPQRCVNLLSALMAVRTPEQGYRRGGHQPSPEALRLLDPCCGQGDACSTLAERLREKTEVEIITYGVELEKNRAERSREKLDHILSSDIGRTYIANNAFHLLFLNPPYDFDQEEKRMEHAFLTQCTRYLVDGGTLALVVPRHRLKVSARYLASHYTQMECRRFPDPEYDDFDQVILLGRRRIKPEHMPDFERRIHRWSDGPLEEMQTLEESAGRTYRTMMVPTGEKGEVLFGIRSVDPERAALEARRSGLWANASIQESLWPAEITKVQPLMPLRQGHMAMLAAAGFLDNLCLEIPGRRVMVKGRTTKEMVLVSSTEDEEVWQDRMHTTIRVLDLDTGEIQDVKTQGRKTG